jgi:hypothetical protein
MEDKWASTHMDIESQPKGWAQGQIVGSLLTSQLKSSCEDDGSVVERPHTAPQRSRQKQLSEPCSSPICFIRRTTLPRGNLGAGFAFGRCTCQQQKFFSTTALSRMSVNIVCLKCE